MAKAKTSIEIKAPIQKVYEVVTDFERYPEFVSDTKAVKILKKTAKKLEVEFQIQVVKTITYSLEIILDPPHGCSWRLIKGEFMKSNDGGWALEEVKKGVTLANYEVEVGFGMLVPKSIANMLISKNLPKLLQEFKNRIEKT